jgi:hypothetical protein
MESQLGQDSIIADGNTSCYSTTSRIRTFLFSTEGEWSTAVDKGVQRMILVVGIFFNKDYSLFIILTLYIYMSLGMRAPTERLCVI